MTQSATSRIDVCTLFEGDYHLGVAALANSLYTGGYRGTIWAGTRGALPAWLAKGRATADGVTVRAVPVESGWHLAHTKPAFMRRVLDELDPAADAALYFDPDITTTAPWPFFANWVGLGVALVEDAAYARLPRTHPWRATWRDLLARAGRPALREVDWYVNSGFAGVPRSAAGFLDAWAASLSAMADAGVDLRTFKPGRRTDPYFGTDQDAMNMAVMATDVPVSLIGPDAMGFTPAGYVMQHAVDSPKPWRARYVWRLLRTGTRPDLAHKQYWRFARGLFMASSLKSVRLARLSLRTAIALSRFYSR